MAAPTDGKSLAHSYLTMYFGEVAAQLATLDTILGRKVTMNDVELTTWIIGLVGKATSAEEFVLSIRDWDKAAMAMESFHETYDLYLTPTTAMLPAKIGELEPSKAEKVAMHAAGKLGVGGALKKLGIVEQVAENKLKKNSVYTVSKLNRSASNDSTITSLSIWSASRCTIHGSKRKGRSFIFTSRDTGTI